MKVFVSCVFNSFTKQIIQLTKEIFKMYRIEVFVSGEVEPKPPPESIRGHIKSSDALFAIVTREKSEWVQNEIGIAYATNILVYAIVEENLEIGGIIPQIVIYERFNPQDPSSIVNVISRVAKKIKETRPEEKAEIYRLFKNKRERIIYEIGAHAASHQLFILLKLNDISPAFYDLYREYHENELNKLIEELKQLE